MTDTMKAAGHTPDVKCVNAHDRCYEGGPCPYCEVTAYRDAQGQFAAIRLATLAGDDRAVQEGGA